MKCLWNIIGYSRLKIKFCWTKYFSDKRRFCCLCFGKKLWKNIHMIKKNKKKQQLGIRAKFYPTKGIYLNKIMDLLHGIHCLFITQVKSQFSPPKKSGWKSSLDVSVYSGCTAANSSQAFFFFFLTSKRFLLFKQQPNIDIYLYNSAFLQTLHNNKRAHKHRGHKVSVTLHCHMELILIN